jgi:hypothetical protein
MLTLDPVRRAPIDELMALPQVTAHLAELQGLRSQRRLQDVARREEDVRRRELAVQAREQALAARERALEEKLALLAEREGTTRAEKRAPEERRQSRTAMAPLNLNIA